MWQFDMNSPAFDACSCIFFGHGWMTSLLHPLICSSARGFLLVLPSLAHKLYIFLFVTFYELFQAIYLLFFPFSILPSLLSLICLHFSISLFPIIDYSDSTSCTHAVPPVPPRQTYPITRTITVKAKL